MNKPTIAVVIPHRESYNFILDTLQSLVDQTYQPKTILIADDGSKNGDWRKLIVLWETWKYRIPQLKICRLTENPAPNRSQRIPYVRNKGFMSLGYNPDYIMFADADDKFGSTYFEESIKLLEADENLGYVYPDVHMWDGYNGIRKVRASDFCPKTLFKTCYVSYCAVIRTEHFLHAGMWPEDQYKKEYIFWNIISRIGHPGKRLSGKNFYYRYHANQRSKEGHPKDKDRLSSRHYINNVFNLGYEL